MKQSIRFFSIGLLTASIILFGFFYFFNDTTVSSDNVPIEDMVSEIESQGYRVITENEFISYTLNKDDEVPTKDKKEEAKPTKQKSDSDDKKDNSTKNKNDKKKDNDKKDDVIKAKFTTKDGVVTQDVADILIEKKIIKDRQKFLDYLDDNDYSPYIQIGTFEVTNDMTLKEIAEVITTYPGN